MNNAPFVIERTYDAPSSVVWEAITRKEKMKEWYFDLQEFRAEEGFEFEFSGGSEEKTYLHLCKVTEVVNGRKLSYSWRYEGYPGSSVVTFELFPEGDKTRVKLTHAGLETFATDNKDFRKESFAAGWTDIIGKNLKEYVEKKVDS